MISYLRLLVLAALLFAILDPTFAECKGICIHLSKICGKMKIPFKDCMNKFIQMGTQQVIVMPNKNKP